MVLWTAAREVLARAPTPPQPPDRDGGLLWGWVGATLFVATAAWAWGQRPRTASPSAPSTPDVAPPKRRRLPQIDASTCLGCSACIDACPYDVLVLDRYIAKLERPNDCCGLTLCEQRCPNGSLVVHDGDPIEDRPRVLDTLESEDVPGLYLAGDLTGMPLIRNAINQGAVAVEQLAAGLPVHRDAAGDRLDVVIVGAGPAGLSAALEAKKRQLRFVVLEQGTVAHSIQSFPRGKLVFDQPLGVPLVGELWLAEATKEELLRQWLRIVRRYALPISEESRVTALRAVGDGADRQFEVEVAGSSADPVRARRVVLASGRRGTPRRLDAAISASMEPHVHYSLADARTFSERSVVVVGLGDVAMETAVAIAHQPGTRVTLVYRGSDFKRGKARNIERVRRAIGTGRIRMLWSSAVEAVDEGTARIQTPEGSTTVPCSAVFVMIGSIAPWAFLAAAGVRRAGSVPPEGENDREARSESPGAR